MQRRFFAIGSAALLSLVQVIGVSEVVRSAPQPSATLLKPIGLCYASKSTATKPIPTDQIPQIVQSLRTVGPSEKRCAVLDQLRDIGQPAVSYLIPLLSDRDRVVRLNGAAALGKIGVLAASAIPNLIPLLKDADATVRWSTVSSLGFMGEAAKVAIPGMILLLKDVTPEVRSAAVFALGSMGKHGKIAIPNLIPLLKDSDQMVSIAAANALKKLGYTR